MEEEEILRSQQLDLIYSQSGMLYKILPNTPWAKTGPTKATPNPHIDGFIGSAVIQVTRLMGKVYLQQNPNQSHTQENIPSIKVLYRENQIKEPTRWKEKGKKQKENWRCQP